MSKSRYIWTRIELDYLREIAKDRYIFEITELMSIKFGYEFRKSQIKSDRKGLLPCGLSLWLTGQRKLPA